MAKEYLVGILNEQANLDFTGNRTSEITVKFTIITKDAKYDTVINAHSDFMGKLVNLCRNKSDEFYNDDIPTRLEGSE